MPWSSSTSASAVVRGDSRSHTFCELRMKIGSASTNGRNSRAKCSARPGRRRSVSVPTTLRPKRARAHGDDAGGAERPAQSMRGLGPCGIDGATGQDHVSTGVAEDPTITTLRAMNASVIDAGLASTPTPHRLGHAGGAACRSRAPVWQMPMAQAPLRAIQPPSVSLCPRPGFTLTGGDLE